MRDFRGKAPSVLPSSRAKTSLSPYHLLESREGERRLSSLASNHQKPQLTCFHIHRPKNSSLSSKDSQKVADLQAAISTWVSFSLINSVLVYFSLHVFFWAYSAVFPFSVSFTVCSFYHVYDHTSCRKKDSVFFLFPGLYYFVVFWNPYQETSFLPIWTLDTG